MDVIQNGSRSFRRTVEDVDMSCNQQHSIRDPMNACVCIYVRIRIYIYVHTYLSSDVAFGELQRVWSGLQGATAKRDLNHTHYFGHPSSFSLLLSFPEGQDTQLLRT